MSSKQEYGESSTLKCRIVKEEERSPGVMRVKGVREKSHLQVSQIGKHHVIEK